MEISSIPFLATAIALVISWSLFALLCSFIHEAIAQIKAERGRFMKDYLLQQLQDIPNGVNWASLLYLHGPIDLLSRTTNKPTSDIAPHLFAESMVEVVGKAHLVQIQIPTLSKELRTVYAQPVLNNYKIATHILKPSDVASFFAHALQSAELQASKNDKGVINETDVYRALVANIESWYVEFTQRLTLWYKKKVRLWLFSVGVLLGIVINVDSIQLFSFYNANADERNAVIILYQSNADTLSSLAHRLERDPSHTISIDSLRTLSKWYIAKADSMRVTAALPVGYDYSILKQFKQESWPQRLFKLLGILISGFAASFGAPFWFDLLKKATFRKS
jgi:hypothetical protein